MGGRRRFALAIFAAVGVLAAGGYAVQARTPDRAPPAAAGAKPKPGPVEQGRALYLKLGCQACHGLSGEGTKIGPPVAGHTKEQTIRQVRSPLDQMPAYTRARLSDADLQKIAAFVASLAPTGKHVEPVDLADIVVMHHWMALSAVEARNLRDAHHHVAHIVAKVKGKHRTEMKRAQTLLRKGKLHKAAHLIATQLGSRAKPTLGLKKLRLELALAAIEHRERAEALHQIRHFLEKAKGTEASAGRSVQALIQKGDLHDAKHAIERLLGRDVHD